MNDTSVRFLKAVLERVAEDRIVEVRLFPAIRQGGIESGVAVLAVEPEPDVRLDADGLAHDPVDTEALSDEVEVTEERAGDDNTLGGLDVEVTRDPAAADGADDGPERVEVARGVMARRESLADSGGVVAAVFEALDRESTLVVTVEGPALPARASARRMAEVEVVVDAPPLAADAADLSSEESIALGDILLLPSPGPAGGTTTGDPGHRRLAILCARYKLIIKGPDRGKWELEVMHQADAPLHTLERVIAGVVRRSGEGSEPERFTRHSLRETLDAPAWARSA